MKFVDVSKLRQGAVLATAAVGALAFAAPALAQDSQEPLQYPHDVLTMVTHSSPGGGSDVFLREMAGYLSEILGGIDIVVENVVGGSSASAMSHMVESPADGSVLYATTPTFIYTSLMSDLEASYDDLEPLVNVFYDPQVIYTRADAPFETLDDVLEYAKENRSAWGAASPGSLERITLEQLKSLTGVDAAIVTTEGGGETLINVLNGTLDMAIGEIQELRTQIEGGEVKLLATITEERVEQFPEVPTVKESGIDLVVRKFRGLAGPKGLPEDVIAIWEQAIPRLLEHPEYKARYTELNLVPAYVPHEEYEAMIASFAEENRKFLVQAGVIQE